MSPRVFDDDSERQLYRQTQLSEARKAWLKQKLAEAREALQDGRGTHWTNNAPGTPSGDQDPGIPQS